MKTGKWLFLFTIGLAVLGSCSKPEDDELLGTNNNDELIVSKDNSGSKSGVLPSTRFPGISEFCEYKEYNFWAGQTLDAGDVLVGNTNDSLFIRVTSTAGFQNVAENLKIWIGATMPFTSRPPAGSFPYKFTVPAGQNTVYIGFSLAELELKCDAAFYILVHGDVAVAVNNATRNETAWAGDHQGDGSAWWYYIHYVPECCEPPVECDLSAKAVITDVKCFGASTGAIDLTVENGTSPFTFAWSNGATTEDLTNIPAGTYSVTVYDSKQCYVTLANLVVGQPASGISASAVVTDISVYGAHDGAINVTVSGGTPPYSFLWSTGATTEDLSGLGPGNYSVDITDANGCNAALKGLLVEEPEEEKPKGDIAFARKTYDPMVHCFLDLDLNGDGTKDFDTWGWTNGAMYPDETFESTYFLYIKANSCDISNAVKVGVVKMHYYAGIATVKITLEEGFVMNHTSVYIGNDMLPKEGGNYTTDPAFYPYQHDLTNATTDTFTVNGLSGNIYIIVNARILPAVD